MNIHTFGFFFNGCFTLIMMNGDNVVITLFKQYDHLRMYDPTQESVW